MIRFIKNLALFGLPLVLWTLFVILIDPFNYFDFSSIISNEIKEQNALTVNSLMYYAFDFHNDPCENILIGDSRINNIPLDEIDSISGLKYKKLRIDAANLNEIIDLFYLAKRQRKLNHVVLGINFNLFNEFDHTSRVGNIESMINNPLKYIFNRNVAQACFYVIRGAITGKNIQYKPSMTRDEYWNYYIETKGRHWYAKYKYSENLNNRLVSLDSSAIKDHIKLTLIILPLSREFHERLVEFGLSKVEDDFLYKMGKLQASIINYDFENDITKNKSNFMDPVHFNKDIGHILVNEIWQNNLFIGRRLK
jgi:hypothetical protein